MRATREVACHCALEWAMRCIDSCHHSIVAEMTVEQNASAGSMDTDDRSLSACSSEFDESVGVGRLVSGSIEEGEGVPLQQPRNGASPADWVMLDAVEDLMTTQNDDSRRHGSVPDGGDHH